MFFISWGSRVCQLLFGAPETHHCEICHQDRSFRNVVTYKVMHILWLFRWVASKSYGRICEVCRNGPALPASQFEVKGKPSPIPFIDRMGWSVGLGGIAALAVMGSVAGANESALTDAALAAPRAGDLYEVDMTKLEAHPEAPVMYSVLQVTRASGGTVDVRTAKTYFNGLRGVTEAVRTGRARADDYYDPQAVTLPLTALKKMRQDGAILSVDRL